MPSRSRASSSKVFRARASTLCFAVAAGLAFAAAARAAEHTVVIDAVKYEPAALTVSRGETVVWINKDPFPHTVTARGAFDSRDIASGKSWKLTARKPGIYEYVCTLHPGMKGTLTVK
jgi:plastocyanin